MKRLKMLRQKQGLTQSQLAEKLFMHRNTIRNYEQGKTKPNLLDLEKIANYFNVDIAYFSDEAETTIIHMTESDLFLIAKYQKAIEEIINKYKK